MGQPPAIDGAYAVCLHLRMLRSRHHTRVNIVVATLFALAVAFLGFAHKPIALASPADIDLAAYAAPDGSLPPICGQTDGKGGAALFDHHCDACALTASPGLPPAAQSCLPAPRARWLATRPLEVARVTPASFRAPTSRGPPLS